ncbi:hypothetical protein ALC56_04557 [Trachymyrmex septentrionalis]|uniref:Uncharacterized protein n=1 Tax=Trachymyrmex septentrionalis TaxID=34720 RepID=A0A195FL58_9HYME|nr:hypothetical protein ALC56_04557 [Trachymyrmex septentrionalis]
MVLDLPGRTRASLISFREWAYGLAFGVEMPFHSLSSVCTVRTRDAPVEIQMTMGLSPSLVASSSNFMLTAWLAFQFGSLNF